MGPDYQAMLGTHVHNENAIYGERGKASWEKPSPKKRDEKGCMDGWSNQDPPITTYIQYIHKRKMRRGREKE